MIKSRKQMYVVIGVFALVLMLFTTTYAFFNYTRTGTSNTIRVGRIAFNSSQSGNINLTNAFPITSTEAETDTTNAKSVSITVTGDTDYANGVEYLVTTSDVNMTVGGKQLPVTLEIDVEGDNSKTLGTLETGDYYTNRENYSTSKYKVEYNGELEDGTHLLVGYIAPNATSGTAEGVDGVINIKAYIDASKVLISDTYDGTESDNMGTPNSLAEGKTVFTTTEWNSIQSSPLSFKVKVEANEGIWVEEPLTFGGMIGRRASTASYIASYDDIISNSPNQSFATHDQVSDSATKQTVYYYTGNEAAANSNVLFAGYCWQIVRTTDNGGVRMIYNGIAQKPVIASTPITNTDITYTNDGTYAYTYDSTTKKWTSANTGVASSTDIFIFSVNTAGDYAINYKVSSQANNDYAKIYIKPTGGSFVLQTQYSGEVEGTFDLGTLGATDEVKIEYTKNGSTDTGNDNIIFDIASVNTRGDIPVCAQDRRITGIKGINAIEDGTTQSMSAATRYGRSFDYDLTTGEFTIEDSTGLPTSWSTSDNNSNGTEDYKELIGTYTCLSNSVTCSTLYYVGSINQDNTAQAYVAKYTIGDVAHYSQLGTSAFNANYKSPSLVGYMFNTEYDYKSGSKSGEYYTTATWNGTTYDLTSSNNGSVPDVEHHYICDTDCTKVRYYYYSTNYYILLENGTTVEDAIYKMTGNGTVETKSKTNNANYELNNYNSAMKGYLDNWYKKNLTGYTSFLDGTSVYCNDRSIRELGGWNPTNSPSLTTTLQFYQYSANRDLNCVNEWDRFAVTNTKAKLTYPIGLLTEPERNLMTANFAKTRQYYWGASPDSFNYSPARVRYVHTSGDVSFGTVLVSYGARGVVSLRPGTKLEKGTGTYNDPYIVGPIVARTS